MQLTHKPHGAVFLPLVFSSAHHQQRADSAFALCIPISKPVSKSARQQVSMSASQQVSMSVRQQCVSFHSAAQEKSVRSLLLSRFLHTFVPQSWLTSPVCPESMSKVRIPINPIQVGKVGAYSMYVRDGEQIVRQRKNASNYGESASRSYLQQERRVMWQNLVNLYKVMREWQPKAYENKEAGQTDYNKFMSVNANNANVPLSKQQATDGACVVAPVFVSQGSLRPGNAQKLTATTFSPDLYIDFGTLPSVTTVGQLSQIIEGNNQGWMDGDNLAVVLFTNFLDVTNVPRAESYYYEMTLDKSSSTLLSAHPLGQLMTLSSSVDSITITAPASIANECVAAVCIHTRVGEGVLKVSTERIVMLGSEVITPFLTPEAKQAAIESYGLSTRVLLYPGSQDQ